MTTFLYKHVVFHFHASESECIGFAYRTPCRNSRSRGGHFGGGNRTDEALTVGPHHLKLWLCSIRLSCIWPPYQRRNKSVFAFVLGQTSGVSSTTPPKFCAHFPVACSSLHIVVGVVIALVALNFNHLKRIPSSNTLSWSCFSFSGTPGSDP